MRRSVPFFLALVVMLSAAVVCGAEEAHTPPVGSAERRAILDTLRADILENSGLEVVFVVQWLKVQDGWAWVETHPQSRDGMDRYESFIALLEKNESVWAITEIPALEQDSPPIDDEYFRGLLERYPGIPEEIFPWGR